MDTSAVLPFNSEPDTRRPRHRDRWLQQGPAGTSQLRAETADEPPPDSMGGPSCCKPATSQNFRQKHTLLFPRDRIRATHFAEKHHLGKDGAIDANYRCNR
jgi:hypothetical protein